jgi:hypothetical protein
MQFMRSQTPVQRVLLGQGDSLVRDSLYLRVEPLVATLESRIENDAHALRSEESGGNFPAFPRRRASRAQRKIFFLVTSSPARSMSASNSFFGIMTKSSLPARVFGIVMVAMLPVYQTYKNLFAREVELLEFLARCGSIGRLTLRWCRLRRVAEFCRWRLVGERGARDMRSGGESEIGRLTV